MKQIDQNATKTDNGDPDAVDIAIARALIENPSICDGEIAEKIGVARQTVNKRKNSDTVRRLLIQSLSLSEKRFRRLASKALFRLEEALDDEDSKVRLSVAMLFFRSATALMQPQPATGTTIQGPDIYTDERGAWLDDGS